MFIRKGGKNVGARIRSVFIPQDFLQTEPEFREVFNQKCVRETMMWTTCEFTFKSQLLIHMLNSINWNKVLLFLIDEKL